MKARAEDRLSARRMLEEDNQGYASQILEIPDGATTFHLDSRKPKKIDLIPYVVGKNNPQAEPGTIALFRSYYVHYDIGPEKQRVLCPKSFGKRCPICEEYERLSWDERKEPYGKSIRSKKRQLWNIIDTEDREAGIQIWDISDFLFAEALRVADQALDEDDPRLYYSDPTAGYTLKLTVSEQSRHGSTYYKVERVDFIERKKQYKETIKKEAWCLDRVLKPPMDYDELKELFLQTSTDELEEDEEPLSDGFSSQKGLAMKRKSATAEQRGIEVGTRVKHPDISGECVVVKVSKDGFSLSIEDEDGDIHKGIGVAEVAVIEETEEKEKKKKKGKSQKLNGKLVTKKRKQEDDEEDELDDDEEDEEDEEDDEEDDEDDEDDEEDDLDDDDDDDDDEEEDFDDDEELSEKRLEDEEEEDEEEEAEPPRKKRGRPPKKSKTR